MNKIKGLIKKDFLELKSYKKNFLFSILIYIIIIVLNADNNSMIFIGTSMIVFLFTVYATATFNYDEKSNAERYILTFPISRKDIVKSKYLLVIISIIIGTIAGVIIGGALFLANVVDSFNILDFFSSLLGLLYVMSLIIGIQIPCIYKFGAEKGRMQIYIIIMIMSILFGLIYMALPSINLIFLNSIDRLIPFILVVLVLLNFYISYLVSKKIFSKKEI